MSTKKPLTGTVKNLLDDVFTRPEKDVTYFVGVMAANSQAAKMPGKSQSFKQKLQSGEPEKMRAAVFSTQQAGNVVIQHGWDYEDYVWHIEPAARRKWATSVDRAIYATAKAMKDVVPDNVFVRIFRPYADWEIKVFTFKAIGLKQCWNVTPSDIERLNLNLFKVLNALV
jgi:hypothetical protein